MKVYELAKNLGVNSMFLMDKIRKEWRLSVKSHMESLSPDLVKEIEQKFSADKLKKTATSEQTKKRQVKRAKTVKKVSSEASTPQPVKKTSTGKPKIIRRRKGESPPAQKLEKPFEKKPEAYEEEKQATPAAEASKNQTQNIRSDMVSVRENSSLQRDSTNTTWSDKQEAVKKPVRKPITEKEVEIKFHAADFRKREIIFQPKKKRTVALVGDVKKTQITKPKAHKMMVKVHGEIHVEELAKKIRIKQKDLLYRLKKEGIDARESPVLDFDTVSLLVSEFGFEAVNTQKPETELLEQLVQANLEKKDTKPPVVTIMGHVDHGKTTLLDTIRKTKVVEQEHGGITQHIGAYSVPFGKNFITFIDTPGHAAFTKMRARGAKVTDLVVIVVSAADGVMPQTVEACNHAKLAKTPLIVACSKMDVEGANIEKVKQELSKHEVVPEDWGGDTPFVPISAVKGEGIDQLLEQIQLVAEVQELKCNSSGLAQGMVIEVSVHKNRGNVVTLILQDGTLKQGQDLLVGTSIERVRQMRNDQQKTIKEAGPGTPVEVMGFQQLPEVGDSFYAFTDNKLAREILDIRKNPKKEASQPSLSVEQLLEQTYGDKEAKKELNIILKADVSGSLEAVKQTLAGIEGEKISLKIIHAGTGAIKESDILLASTVEGRILGFNIQPDRKVQKLAQDKGVDMHTYSIIYELLDDVKKIMLGLLTPDSVEESQGSAEVREIFHMSKVGTIAGCYVTEGNIQRNSFIKVVRDGRLVFEGKLASLKRFKDDVKEVKSGFECGISVENFNDIKPKDVLESYVKKEVKQTEL